MTSTSIYEITHWNAALLFEDTDPQDNISAPLKGIITDLTAPILEREFDTTKRAGELGVVPRPKFYNEVEISFSVRNIYKDFLEALVKGTQRTLQITSTACIESDAGVVEAYEYICKGFVSSLPFGDLSEDGLEAEITMMCHYTQIKLGTTLDIIYDPRNYVLSIGGTNLYAGVKTIIDPA